MYVLRNLVIIDTGRYLVAYATLLDLVIILKFEGIKYFHYLLLQKWAISGYKSHEI